MAVKCVCEVTMYSHGEDWCDCIQGGNNDANLTDASCEQKGPGGLPVGFAMPKHLQQHTRRQIRAGQHEDIISLSRHEAIYHLQFWILLYCDMA